MQFCSYGVVLACLSDVPLPPHVNTSQLYLMYEMNFIHTPSTVCLEAQYCCQQGRWDCCYLPTTHSLLLYHCPSLHCIVLEQKRKPVIMAIDLPWTAKYLQASMCVNTLCPSFGWTWAVLSILPPWNHALILYHSHRTSLDHNYFPCSPPLTEEGHGKI